MTVKLTLSVNEDIVKKAKEIAKTNGKSISKMVEDFFLGIPLASSTDTYRIHPEVRKLRGIIKNDDGKNYKDIIAAEILKKHS